jgi:hypothetical protein
LATKLLEISELPAAQSTRSSAVVTVAGGEAIGTARPLAFENAAA